MIGNINYDKKIGYDIREENIKCGKLIHPMTIFKYGSFSELKEKHIFCLIMVNFIHGISEENLLADINQLMKERTIEYFVLDTFTQNNISYKYSHSGNYLFGEKYRLIQKRGFPAADGARRYVEIWKLSTD